jgi:hypothetical protein
LEGILGVMQVSKHSLTHPKYHRPVTIDESFKCRLFSTDKKGIQELTIRHALATFQERGFSNVPHRTGQVARPHICHSLEGNDIVHLHWAESINFIHFFSKLQGRTKMDKDLGYSP